jgi:hypothetical protein
MVVLEASTLARCSRAQRSRLRKKARIFKAGLFAGFGTQSCEPYTIDSSGLRSAICAAVSGDNVQDCCTAERNQLNESCEMQATVESLKASLQEARERYIQLVQKIAKWDIPCDCDEPAALVVEGSCEVQHSISWTAPSSGQRKQSSGCLSDAECAGILGKLSSKNVNLVTDFDTDGTGSVASEISTAVPAAETIPVTDTSGARRAKIEQQICRIYSIHNMSKLPDVPRLMAKYRGKEHCLLQEICTKYRVPHLDSQS